MLANYADFPCLVVTGDYNGTGHMWSKVMVDGQWYNVDCTVDDPVPDQKGKVRYDMFLRSDAYLKQQDYTWNESLWPEA